MRPCFVINLTTPKKYDVRGLWFGPKRAKRVIIMTQGLGGSVMSQHWLITPWVDKRTAVITYNNRGHDQVSTLYRDANNKKGHVSTRAGAAHEVFTDCVDDVQGVINFAKRQGVKEVYLAGHSTGCQKSAYYASKKADRVVKGLILLAPVSDYAAMLMLQGTTKLARATTVARALVRAGKKHDLLPKKVWHELVDAQRFLSLYTPESAEEIFSYIQPKKNPATLRTIKLPILAILAERDEFAERPKEIALWFAKHLNKKSKVKIIPKVSHGFKGGEKMTAALIRNWLK